MGISDNQPWYKDGLRFKCTECGNCCTGFSGYVWVNKEEMTALAELLDLDLDEFERLYTRKIGIRYSLKEFPNGSCVFFDEEKRNCSVYPARPRQCRTWPFWNSNLLNEERWQQTCESCPGAGKGKLYQLDEVNERRNEFRI
ncbi:MAG: YkgJ family cysteine cluster protein [Pirellulaceae bacterium]